jgi:UDP-N-acetylmuramyl pentapeptide phosphotransferase/UDP-N-acetylglucosamine-1-phosphate transferase
LITGGCEAPSLCGGLGCFLCSLLGLVVCSRLRNAAMRERLFSVLCVLAAGDTRFKVSNFPALIGAYFSAIRMRWR